MSKSGATERGTTVVVPDAAEENIVIVPPRESNIQPPQGEGGVQNIEVLERPEISGSVSSESDTSRPVSPPSGETIRNVPPPENRERVRRETIINVQQAPVVEQAPQQRPVLTIEDILADPIKNKAKLSSRDDSLSLTNDTEKTDFLEGKWRCETDLINLENNTPIVMDFTFDKNGRGTALLKEKSGRMFTGSANATLKRGVLDIKVAKLVTPNSSATYNGSDIQCKQKDATAVCSGKNTGNPPVVWTNASFHRIK